jgi:hypothetical protein
LEGGGTVSAAPFCLLTHLVQHMNKEATKAIQELAVSGGGKIDDALFLQTVPDYLIAAMARGSVNLLDLVQEELVQRGLDRQGQWVGPEAAAAFAPPQDSVDIDTFADEEHARIVAFRNRWHEANQVNPETFPLYLPKSNAGLWGEQLFDFDTLDPFPLPVPPKNQARTPGKPKR